MIGYAIIQLPEMVLSFYQISKAWIPIRSFPCFQKTPKKDSSLYPVHSLNTHDRNLSADQKMEEVVTRSHLDTELRQLKLEMQKMFAPLKKDKELKEASTTT